MCQGGLLCRAQGPCGHLQSETVHHGYDGSRASRRTNHTSGLYRADFNDFVASEIREVVARKIENLLTRGWRVLVWVHLRQKLRALMRDRFVLLE